MRNLFDFFKNNPEWMKEFYSGLKTLSKERPIIIIIAALILILTISNIATHKSSSIKDQMSIQNKRSESILHELNEINAILHDVEKNPHNTKEQQDALQTLEKNIISTQKSLIDVAKNTDIQKISTQLTSVKDDIDSKMDDLKKAVSKNIADKEYLDASKLPFHVLSIDIIAGQPYTSIEYAGHVSPLSVGDRLAGWRVIGMDYNEALAEFINDKNQYIKVSLQG